MAERLDLVSERDRDIARAALIGLPIWYVGWQILDALKGALL